MEEYICDQYKEELKKRNRKRLYTRKQVAALIVCLIFSIITLLVLIYSRNSPNVMIVCIAILSIVVAVSYYIDSRDRKAHRKEYLERRIENCEIIKSILQENKIELTRANIDLLVQRIQKIIDEAKGNAKHRIRTFEITITAIISTSCTILASTINSLNNETSFEMLLMIVMLIIIEGIVIFMHPAHIVTGYYYEKYYICIRDLEGLLLTDDTIS